MHIKPDVLSVINEDGAVLLDLKHGKYFSLNGIGVEIWQTLEAGKNLPEIEAHLAGLYDVPADVLRRDIAGFIERLSAAELIDAAG